MATPLSAAHTRPHAVFLLAFLTVAWGVALCFMVFTRPLEFPALPDPAGWPTHAADGREIRYLDRPSALWLAEHRDDDHVLTITVDGQSRQEEVWRAIAAHTVLEGGAVIMTDHDEFLYAAVPEHALEHWRRTMYHRAWSHRDDVRTWLAEWDPGAGRTAEASPVDRWTLVRFNVTPGRLTGAWGLAPPLLALLCAQIPLLMVAGPLLSRPWREACSMYGSILSGLMVHHAAGVVGLGLLTLAYAFHMAVASGTAGEWEQASLRVTMLYNALSRAFEGLLPTLMMALVIGVRLAAVRLGRARGVSGFILTRTDPFRNDGWFEIGVGLSSIALSLGLSPLMRL